MSRMIFVNLPVRDLTRAKSFYESLGFVNNPQFSDDTAACMVWSETIFVMILTHAKWATFTSRPIPDMGSSEVMLCLSCRNREEVNKLADAAGGNGGTADINPSQDHGFMMSRSFADPDGHVWEVMWMDPAAASGEVSAEHVA
ncbi:MAG TPA: VOC family protein [Novosphingobium sp.]|nr:VOC family protein [Novosphingobium sp.]